MQEVFKNRNGTFQFIGSFTPLLKLNIFGHMYSVYPGRVVALPEETMSAQMFRIFLLEQKWPPLKKNNLETTKVKSLLRAQMSQHCPPAPQGALVLPQGNSVSFRLDSSAPAKLGTDNTLCRETQAELEQSG